VNPRRCCSWFSPARGDVHLFLANNLLQCNDCRPLYLLLGGAIGRGQAAGPPILVDGCAVDDHSVLCCGIALGQHAVQDLFLHSLQQVHLQGNIGLNDQASYTFVFAAPALKAGLTAVGSTQIDGTPVVLRHPDTQVSLTTQASPLA
jgi:hypothetical protein